MSNGNWQNYTTSKSLSLLGKVTPSPKGNDYPWCLQTLINLLTKINPSFMSMS